MKQIGQAAAAAPQAAPARNGSGEPRLLPEALPEQQFADDGPAFDLRTATFRFKPDDRERPPAEFSTAIQAKVDKVTAGLRKRLPEALPEQQFADDGPAFDLRTATFHIKPDGRERPPAEFSTAIQAKVDEITAGLRRRLAEAGDPLASTAAGLVSSSSSPCRWRLLTYGPVRLDGDPPYKVCNTLRSGEPALIIGVSWADAGTPVPAHRYLAGKPYHAGFQAVDRSAMEPGPAVELRGNFSVDQVHLFPCLLVPEVRGPQVARFDVTFYVDLAIPGLDEANLANWHSDTGLEWREGPSNRFFVSPPSKLSKV